MYDFITFNVKNMLQIACEKKNDQILFDLNDRLVYDSIVVDIHEYEDCALFYQAKKVLEKEELKCLVGAGEKRKLFKCLVYMDFTGISTQEKEAEQKLFNQGFYLIFPNDNADNKVFYLPFDKSSSMARNARMTFAAALPAETSGNVNDSISFRKLLDERVMLGWDLSGSEIKLALSKLYAYRGLMLSTADRIEFDSLLAVKNEEKAKMLAQSIIVVNIDEKPQKVNVISASRVEKEPKQFTEKDEDGAQENGSKKSRVWNTKISEGTIKNIDRYDGEGLICPEWSETINKELKGGASSYQIRMPFIKGMLHKVNFHKFYIDELKSGEIKVKDIYGTERKLSEAKIILTKSMFKCHKWLKIAFQKKPEDEAGFQDKMEWFFYRLLKFDHALYISNTDAMLHNDGTVKLNYQFLVPMSINREQLRGLFEKRAEERKELALKKLKSNAPDGENMDDERISSKAPAWSRALAKNEDVKRENKVAGMLHATEESILRDMAIGRILVDGQCRFLSRDLLSLLLDIASLDENYKQSAKERRSDTLRKGRFYMPGLNKKYSDRDEYHAILRNPHLSRNEECLMRRAFDSKAWHLNIYDKYFGHLSGIIMVNYDSLAPMALSGADFDGDLVKIVHDTTIVDAVKNGILDKNEAQRLLPIDIPSVNPFVKEYETDDNGIIFDCKTILDTFASRVGHISNMAVPLAKNDSKRLDNPNSNESDDFRKGLTDSAECTILTGLEIDAAKNGERPSLTEIEMKVGNRRKDYFVAVKDKMKYLPRFNGWYTRASTDGGYEIRLSDSRRLHAKVKIIDENGSPVDALPWLFVKQRENEKASDNGQDTQYIKRNKVFDFYAGYSKSKIDLLKSIENMSRGKISEIVKRYNEVLQRASSDYKSMQSARNIKYGAKIRGTLTLQYDSLEESYFEDKSVKVVFRETYDAICGKILKDISDDPIQRVKAELRDFINSGWQYMPLTERHKYLKEKYGFENKDAAATLLSNFDHGGFRILYYIIKSILIDVSSETIEEMDKDRDGYMNPDIVDRIGSNEDEEKEATEHSKDAPDKASDYMEIYITNRREKKSDWQGILNDKCRADILEEVNTQLKNATKIAVEPQTSADLGNMLSDTPVKVAMAAVYSLRNTADKSGNFFWNVFSSEEILDCLVVPNQIQQEANTNA